MCQKLHSVRTWMEDIWLPSRRRQTCTRLTHASIFLLTPKKKVFFQFVPICLNKPGNFGLKIEPRYFLINTTVCNSLWPINILWLQLTFRYFVMLSDNWNCNELIHSPYHSKKHLFVQDNYFQVLIVFWHGIHSVSIPRLLLKVS